MTIVAGSSCREAQLGTKADCLNLSSQFLVDVVNVEFDVVIYMLWVFFLVLVILTDIRGVSELF